MPIRDVWVEQTVLFLFAHQDDEFGVFQKIVDEQRNHSKVRCAYLTDGVFEGKSSQHRNRESLAVLDKLGVHQSDVFFAGQALSIPDGGLPDHLETAINWLKSWYLQCQPVASIYVPAWEGGHQDHDALHAIGVMFAQSIGPTTVVKQFPLYNAYRCIGPLFRVLSPLPLNGKSEVTKVPWANRLRFLRYCLSYPSQSTSWIGLFPFVLLHFIFSGTQVLQVTSLERIRQRPHSGPLYYEKRHFYTCKKLLDSISACEDSTKNRRNLT